ncbi:spermidine/putrescine ABC transporter, permease protein PotB [Methylococcus capsulatus str. Bath]|uniref:Spermidine/putrescine ABC transporter, permease protein PotB n=1 Tax=Methylococcus capsulatus (strain ATCC 33009 / NCIMB 11132 / Bath) TaxID=243233 RepID=Q60AI2_METCA|nr:spermidine/putrescine ABC transporter permease PotB [Methylococcus capsulatus]AAU93012.1 spermidine/putrescine ABC transporter, permease protein PotB [Methylococcus capsulatus str. Bath]
MTQRPEILKTVTVGLLAGWLLSFVLAPTLLVVGLSLLSRSPAGFAGGPVTLDNYRRLADPIYLHVFAESFATAFIATLLCLLLGYPFAYGLARARPGLRPLLLILVIVPFWTSSLVRIYAIRGLLAAKGALNHLLLAAGLSDQPVRLLYTQTAEIVGLVHVLLPFMILPLYASLEKLDPRLLEAARDLGAGPFRRFRHVVLPLTLPGVVAGCLLVFLPALGLFYVGDVLGGSRHLLVGNLLKDQFLEAQDWPFGAAASLVLIGLLLAFLALYAYAAKRIAPDDG